MTGEPHICSETASRGSGSAGVPPACGPEARVPSAETNGPNELVVLPRMTRPARFVTVLALVLALAASGQEPPAPTAAASSGEVAHHTGERLSLNLQNVDLKAALQLIADFAEVNLVVAEGVSGTIAVRLVDVPWDEALDLILTANGLGQRQRGNVLLVAPAEAIAAHEQAALESRRALAELAPLETAFIHIRYADANALAGLFDGEAGAFARSERGRVLVDSRTNALIVTETAANLAVIRAAVERLDVPVRQVRIEARVVSANRNSSEQLGVRWGGGGHTNRGDRHLKVGGSLQTLSELQNIIAGAEGARRAISHPGDLVADLGVTDQGASSIGFGLTGPGFLLDVELSALEAAGEAEIIARPTVVTTDKRAALIETGVEIPYQESTHAGGTSISFKDAVLQLQVTPQVTPNGHIALDLEIKQDTVGKIYYGVPSINTTRIATRALVVDGETVVLGGIFQTDKHHATTRTPLLGGLPVIGRLFRRTLQRDDKQELFVFITPRIVPEAVDDEAG